jgi:5-methylcytosine-specific restriction enzyme A
MHVLLTWNPKAWAWTSLREDAVRSHAVGGHFARWSCGNTKDIRVGARAFVMRLGLEPKGLVASGIVTMSPHKGRHWDNEKDSQGQLALYVGLAFDHIADGPPPISFAELKGVAPDFNWTPQASGHRIPWAIAREIERRWAQKTSLGCSMYPDEMEAPLVEGAAVQAWVNRIERDPLARRRCIEHYGAICAACGLSFGEIYGALADGYIHVHHLTPIASVDGEREVDPIQDLRPLCPNCHAVAHMRTPPLSPEEIANMVAFMRGGA